MPKRIKDHSRLGFSQTEADALVAAERESRWDSGQRRRRAEEYEGLAAAGSVIKLRRRY